MRTTHLLSLKKDSMRLVRLIRLFCAVEVLIQKQILNRMLLVTDMRDYVQ